MSLISELMNALQVLPGVGSKTAQRLTFHLLQKDKSGGKSGKFEKVNYMDKNESKEY